MKTRKSKQLESARIPLLLINQSKLSVSQHCRCVHNTLN